MKKCEGFNEPCSEPATKSVEVRDASRWFTIRLCDYHYQVFVRETDADDDIEARY